MSRMGMKVFSATRRRDIAELGDRITEWIRSRPKSVIVTGAKVTQSSDAQFHCVTVIVFFESAKGESTDVPV